MTPQDRAQAILRLEAGSRRTAAAVAEQARFAQFCEEHRLAPDTDAVAVYLTWLLDRDALSGMALRYRLRLLDVAALLAGRQPPSRDRHLRTFLRGLHSEAALGPERNRPPLYVEDVRAVVDAIGRDRLPQARDIALLLLANATGLPNDVLRRLTWDQVKTRRDSLVVDVPHRSRGRGPQGRLDVPAGPRPCAVAAVRDLRRQAGPVNGPMFSRRDGLPPAMSTVEEVLRALPGRGQKWRSATTRLVPSELEPAVAALGRPRPGQLRDRALLTVAFASCLTPTQTLALRAADVTVVDQGLVLTIPGRTGPTAVPHGRDSRYCPVLAWQDWAGCLAAAGRTGPGDAAFPIVRASAVTGDRLDPSALSRIVRLRCTDAGLHQDYAFTSLRIGFIRTAARVGVPDDLILRQAGLGWLSSVVLHTRRERLITHSVAGRLGL